MPPSVQTRRLPAWQGELASSGRPPSWLAASSCWWHRCALGRPPSGSRPAVSALVVLLTSTALAYVAFIAVLRLEARGSALPEGEA